MNVPRDSLQAASQLIHRFHDSHGGNGSQPGLTADQFRRLLTSATGHPEKLVTAVLGPCDQDGGVNCTRDSQCPGIKHILNSLGSGDQLEEAGLIAALPIALNTLTTPTCLEEVKVEDQEVKHRPTLTQSWLYGIGFSSLVAIFISNIGVLLGPCMEGAFFRRLIQFLVSMGAGSLATTGLLVLIPEAFGLLSVKELGDAYIWKATLAILSIFTFFSSERLLKTFLTSRKKKKRALGDEDKSFTVVEGNFNTTNGGGGDASNSKHEEVVGHGHSHLVPGQNKEDRMTLAWMVMGGDIIHNFVDGLSIGAAFTEDISMGISISLAIVCEELPHELADIAILLHSGIGIKKAMLINFLSACVVYVGLVLGILIGSNIHEANLWIFAMAGGLFLYIPLVDMLPDMRNHLDSLLAVGSPEAKTVAVLHLCGLLVGTAIIVFIVNISGYINV